MLGLPLGEGVRAVVGFLVPLALSYWPFTALDSAAIMLLGLMSFF